MLSAGSPLEAAMAVVMAEPKARPAPWPRVWVDQAALLERQHDRLEACLLELLQRHGQIGRAHV